MAAQGRAAHDLDTFDKSDLMKYVMKRVNGSKQTFIDYMDLGTSREAIYAITLLRIKGFTVKEDRMGINVTDEGSI